MATHESGTGTGKVLLRDVADGELPVSFEHQHDPAANRMAAFLPGTGTPSWRTGR